MNAPHQYDPLPWAKKSDTSAIVLTQSGTSIRATGSHTAGFIVQAANNYAALVDLITKVAAMRDIADLCGLSWRCDDLAAEARTLLDSLKGTR